jgi:hypothetical protein
MKQEDKLLAAMGDMEDRYLMEAYTYGKKKTRHLRRTLIFVAAVVAVLATSVTALAANATWRETIRSWMGIGETGISGYEEPENQIVTLGDRSIQQLAQLCSGNQLVVYFEVTAPNGSDASQSIEVQYQDEDQWIYGIDQSLLEVVSQTDAEMLLKLTVSFEDMYAYEAVPIRFYDYSGEEILLSEELTIEITDTPVLFGTLDLPLKNELANADGELLSVQISSGSLEIFVGFERFETWCTRECVPDGGERFCKAYYGEDWVSTGVREEPAYFSKEDEIAIASAYKDTWNSILDEVMASVKITKTDGTVITASGEPYITGHLQETSEEDDVDTYRYNILPLIGLEDMESVEIMGQTVELELLSSAK